VLEAFRRGEFDQIEVVGQADEKEFFELCFKEKILEALAKALIKVRQLEQSFLTPLENLRAPP
jgi:hypothetical protein